MKVLPILFLCALVGAVQAAEPIFKQQVNAPMDQVYQALHQELESRHLWVVFEPDIGRSIAGMAERLGEDYNRSGLAGIRSLVTCNAWYANQVSNLDPDMLALCPLRVSVTHKDGTTFMLFARPTVHAQGSPALPVLAEIEGMVIEAIKSAAALAVK